jgi:hypothetical protein
MREVPRATEPVREVVTSPDEETPEDHDITEVQEPPQMTFIEEEVLDHVVIDANGLID